MSFTIQNAADHAIAFFKGPSTYASSEIVRFGNTVQSIIGQYYSWHWAQVAGTAVSLFSGTQEYTIAAADQNKVLAIGEANLTDGVTQFAPLLVQGDLPVPLTSTSGRPFAVSLTNPTSLRFYPKPDASYTLNWKYYARPVVMTATSNVFDIPEAFTDVVKAGMCWQLLAYADDDRAPEFEKTFFALLENHKNAEQMTSGRRR